MKKVFAVVLLTAVLAFGYVATVLAADPVAPAINLTKSLKQKWVEITLLLGDVNAYLYEIQGKLEEASAADESTKLLAINAIRAARTIKDVFILNVVIPEINDWITEVGAQQAALIGLIEEEGINGGPSLLEVFCPPAGECLPKFPGYARVFNRIDLKLTTIDTIFADFQDELGGDFSDSIGQTNIGDGDTTGETCLDPSDGSTPLDTDLSTDPETLNECLDLAEEFLLADDFGSADLALERAGQLIDDMIEPQKLLLLRKLRQVQIELTSIERELKRLQRVKIKRRPAEELSPSAAASQVVALQALPSLKDVLNEIKGLRILTKDAEYYLHDIDDELDFILDLLAQAKAEIETGATASEVKTLIDLAIEKKELTLLVDLFSLENTIDEMIAQKAELEAKIEALCDAGKIKNPKSCFRITDELAQINAKLAFVKGVIGFITDKLDDGERGALPCLEDPDPPCNDVDDWLADAMDELDTAGDDYDAERIIIDLIKAMDLIHEAMDKKDCILLGLSCPVEDELRGFKGLIKWILTELRFVEKLVRKEVRPVIQPRPRSGELEPLAVQGVEATARELRVLGRGIAGFAVQVYGLNGQVVATREVEGSQLALSELRAASGAPLANGVYLYVVQVKGVDGQMIQTKVNKLVILR